jgi:hypothetical protein
LPPISIIGEKIQLRPPALASSAAIPALFSMALNPVKKIIREQLERYGGHA